MEPVYKVYPNADGSFNTTKSIGDIIMSLPNADGIEVSEEVYERVRKHGKDKFTFDKKTRTLKEKKGK